MGAMLLLRISCEKHRAHGALLQTRGISYDGVTGCP